MHQVIKRLARRAAPVLIVFGVAVFLVLPSWISLAFFDVDDVQNRAFFSICWNAVCVFLILQVVIKAKKSFGNPRNKTTT